jgi:uncharacterized damage-inducible protein DinB
MTQGEEFGVDQMIDAVDQARQGFLKHLEGVTADQAVWKPYPGCKSIAETLDHLLWSDRTLVVILQSGKEPDYTTAPVAPPSDTSDTLKSNLAAAHDSLMSYLKVAYSNSPLDTPVNFWGHQAPLWPALAGLTNEDSYHTGQVAYIRMATDPSWDYYANIYG